MERLFSKEHASLLEFKQALAEELRLKKASLRSTVSALKADCEQSRTRSLRLGLRPDNFERKGS